MDRKLCISFRTDAHVEYRFQRNERALSSYIVEHPADCVEILEGTEEGYQTEVTPEGWFKLVWNRKNFDGWSCVNYLKTDKLHRRKLGEREVFFFSEKIRIKAEPYFCLWLGGPNGPLSAIKEHSRAVFYGTNGGLTEFRPRELTEEVFRASGTLHIDWYLELI